MATFPAIAALKMLQLQTGLWFGMVRPYQWGGSIGVARVESRSCRVIVYLREDAGDGDGTVRCGVRLERVQGIDYHDIMLQTCGCMQQGGGVRVEWLRDDFQGSRGEGRSN